MSSTPVAVDRFPRVRLGHAPTPLEPAPRLGAALGVELWVKRDDCTGLAFGGNKVRQLEFELGEAQARGADTVLVTGAVQSNLVRVAAAAARRLGMEAHLQLEERVDEAGDLYRVPPAIVLLGPAARRHAAFVSARRERGGGRRGAGASGWGARRTKGAGRTWCIPPRSHPPLGGLGYMVAAEELSDAGAGSRHRLRRRGLRLGQRTDPRGPAGRVAGPSDETTPVYGICVRRDARGQERAGGAGGGGVGGDARASRRRSSPARSRCPTPCLRRATAGSTTQ